MVGLLENVGISTRYVWDNLVKHPLRWLGMTGLYLIPLAGLFSIGVCMKAFRNEEPRFEGELFAPGFLVSLVWLIYALPLILVNIFLLNPVAGINVSAFVGLFDILYVIFLVIFLPTAIANYGSTLKFTSAFKFNEMVQMINHNAAGGWGCYIGALFIYGCIFGLLALILSVISNMVFLYVIIVCILAPLIGLFSCKYWANLLVPNAITNGYRILNEEEAHDVVRETIKHLPSFREEALLHKKQNHTLWMDAFLSYPQNIATFKEKIMEFTNSEFTDDEIIYYLHWWYLEKEEN